MRLAAALVLTCLAAPALAQPKPAEKPTATKPAAKPATPPAAAAKPAPAKTGYEAMPVAERIAIQSDLVWTGHLNSTANGEWGPLSLAAVKAFQKRKGGKDTGTLTPEERAALTADAKKKQAEVGWRLVTDASGAHLGIPGKLAPQATRGKSGGHWQSPRGEVQIDVFRETAPATLAAVFETMRKNPARKAEYTVLRPNYFVLSGLEGLKKFYIRAQASNNEVRGFIVRYDQAMQGMMEPVVVAISSVFTPFPTTVQATTDAPPKRMVEYGTGVVVSSAGDIITDREAVDGCQVITAGNLGSAERVAEDKATGLALIRVYGLHDLKPLPLGEGAPAEFTLVGIADPQAQSGNAAVSVASVRMTGTNGSTTMEPAMTQGFAGAPAINASGGFAGIAVQRLLPAPASAVVPVEAVRKLLMSSDVAFTSGHASADAAKDSVVRVICVRKG
jgi:peptidoglycan hydrolase-like protein with peptidoglycan-binding domain